VLIIDDDRELASRFNDFARRQYAVNMLHEPANIFSHMRDFSEVVLLDQHACTGPELAQIIRMNDDDWLRVPVIYLSAETDINRRRAPDPKAGDDSSLKPAVNASVATVFSAPSARLLSTAVARQPDRRMASAYDSKAAVGPGRARPLNDRLQPAWACVIDFFKG
jgi:DNA-binding NtrC family response regulator